MKLDNLETMMVPYNCDAWVNEANIRDYYNIIVVRVKIKSILFKSSWESEPRKHCLHQRESEGEKKPFLKISKFHSFPRSLLSISQVSLGDFKFKLRANPTQ